MFLFFICLYLLVRNKPKPSIKPLTKADRKEIDALLILSKQAFYSRVQDMKIHDALTHHVPDNNPD